MKRLLILLLGPAAGLVLMAAPAAAHPLGNFTVNSFSAIRVQPDQVLVDHVTDRAEIPTQQIATSRGGVSSTSPAAQQQQWRERQCAGLADRLQLTVGGRRVPLHVTGTALRFPPGAGGLVTSRLTCRMVADVSVHGTTSLAYGDDSTGDRIGWREITVAGDGTTLLNSNVPTRSVSRALTAYPADLLSSPLDVRAAAVRARPGGPAAPDPLAGLAAPATAQRRGVDRLTASFTDLIGHPQLGLVVGFVALALAIALGAVHALAPGHGKTVMAAYLVSERGSLRQVCGIGLTVTATHTLGVLGLGIALSLSTTLAPERLYPWLGITSGLLLVSIGVSLLRTSVRRGNGRFRSHFEGHGHTHTEGHSHSHSEGQDHTHAHGDVHEHNHGHVHSHGGRSHSHLPPTGPGVSRRSLLLMGLAGGLVPSPSAVVVLLGAIALHRAWFGVLVVIAYGAGMATTLVGVGVLLSRARTRMTRTLLTRQRAATAFRLLPLVTASVIVLVGSVLTVRAGTSPYLHLP